MNYEGKTKLKVFLALCGIVLLFFAASLTANAAADGVIEAPHVRVVIDGALGNYTDTPIEINSRILLPFREILTKLGVPNDDEHIIWNEEEESVTVWDGKNEIKLVIGDPVMFLNGKAVTFDVAPYFYEKINRTYVPVRAVSELLEKLIMWEDSTTTIFIRNKQNYKETLELLEAMEAAGGQTKVSAASEGKIKMGISTDGVPIPGSNSEGVLSMTMDLTQDIKADLDNNILYVSQTVNVMGTNISSDVMMYKNKIFTKLDAPGSKWTDVTDQGVGDLSSMLEQIKGISGQMDARPASDVAMGLSSVKKADGSFSLIGELVSITDVNSILGMVSGIMPEIGDMDIKMNISKFQIGETFDRDFNPIKSINSMVMGMSLKVDGDDGNSVTIFVDIDMNTTVKYDKIGPDFAVAVPDEVKDLAK